MADPLTLIGAIAASMQIVGQAATAFIATVKLARDLRCVPVMMRIQLNDLEKSTLRLQSLCASLVEDKLVPASILSLNAGQVARISQLATELRSTMDEVQSKLNLAVEGDNPSLGAATDANSVSSRAKGKAKVKVQQL
ncbi:hypothetical protein BKA64DRAFT_93221 [Cadophora sp. MPI-SDFR-AT-0126]|nr:hypothetical protein BKA64DRAFT_93221 [Leotiomycetes sp. MPI-SDFR-AT-0126]